MSHLKPKERLILLNSLQNEAVQALKTNNYNGAVSAFTGFGNRIG